MKNLFVFFVFVVLLLPGLCRAQLNGVDLSAVEAATPLSADQLPLSGTFYSAANPQLPPLPGNIWGWSGWSLGNGIYLLDDLDGSFSGGFHAMDAMDDSGPRPPGSDGGGYEFTSSAAPYAFPTNGLWLWITNVSDGTVYADLNGATDFVYEIFSTTNLTTGPVVTSWNIETEVFPGINTNTMPFTTPTAGRNPLFLWARDWTGITSNGNQTPEWWFWLYFETINLSDDDLDTQGNTLLSDYTNGVDPNVIQFSIGGTNLYVSNINFPIQLNITAGEPFYYAVLVDSTNFSAATWNAYTSSSFTANLGTWQGWHHIWVGLRGRPANATQSWQWQQLDLMSPPLLVITNPTSFTVDEPIIQIHGYIQESVSSINYDISNAAGILTNQTADITDQYFDTNAFGITTNYFDCLDVPLTNGLNTITFHATDLAGDTITTNFNFTVDYSSKTNPPLVQITWPQNGTIVSGTNMICTGWISDPTASVIASFVFSDGNTNIFPNGLYTNSYTGEVGRDGNFSIENLPLNAGTNAFTVAVTDVVGNSCVTNISVTQTNFVLTINPVSPASQLWQPTATVTGTISDPNYAVWVNGVKGSNYGNGTWSANNVPVSNANFTATGYAPNEQQPDGSYGN